MEEYLVIVESPAKAKTIKKYLGKNFTVLASYGHVRDLIPKEGAVDTTNDFNMHYQIIERNAKHLADICKAMKKASALYLATDPDREGEAISWHLCEYLQEKKILKDKPVHRIAFHQITQKAVKEAVDNPRDVSMHLVNAQQARRALDYLVGFNLSPLLWKKIRRGLSAGRVQSPALRLIVERELEIEAFDPKEYWTITADNELDKHAFVAKLTKHEGEKIQQFSITTEKEATKVQKHLTDLSGGTLKVCSVEKKQRKRNPTAPFITSTLQQEAARKLGFTAQRTMRVAQQLYEGIDVGEGAVGLISYMRTDSVNLAAEAIEEIRYFIAEHFGKENVPDVPPEYRTKAKNAQEAHEAIRPTSVLRRPDEIKDLLSAEQFKLYRLIWRRTVASQMIPAKIDTVAVDFECGNDQNIFRANGSSIAHPGFMAVYLEGLDDEKKGDDDEKLLPPFKEGDEVTLKEVKPAQHFTEPPPRFSEATLVKGLEEHGIGRPSTYASIISTLQHREYVVIDSKRFIPTDVGRIVNRFLTKYFPQYVDYDFTAHLEDSLDAVAVGEKEWVPLMNEFWKPFKDLVVDIEKNVERQDVTQEPIDEKCPECEKPLVKRLGRKGLFVGCTAFPECKYTRNVGEDAGEKADAEVIEGRKCPDCEHDLVIRMGPYGKFIGCSQYPTCKHLEPLEKPADTNISCPECKEGHLLQRRTRKKKIFYSCGRYPECKYALWEEPINETCPDCSWPILGVKVTKSRGKEKVCPQKGCRFVEKLADDAEENKEDESED